MDNSSDTKSFNKARFYQLSIDLFQHFGILQKSELNKALVVLLMNQIDIWETKYGKIE